MQTQKHRTFVFITDIPDFLLRPIQTATHRETRDPRYERLRLLLADHTAGIMAVMHLETSGVALALYASEEEALAACQTTIVPESVERDYPPLTLRIIKKEKPLPPEAVYSPTMLIEGETVAKDDLADTRGLERVYRGQRIARWCACTKERQDCSYGVSCDRIHLKAYQRTVRKRPRPQDADEADSLLTSAEARRVQALVLDKQRTQAQLAPMPTSPVPASATSSSPLLSLPTVYVPVELAELEAVLSSTTTTSTASTALLQRIEAALAAYTEFDTAHWPADWATKGPFFMKLSCPGGAPWDWALYDAVNDASKGCESGLARLRHLCPFPADGIATPLQRDLLEQKLLYSVNQLNRFTSVADGLHALRCVYGFGLRDALAEYRAAVEAPPPRAAHRRRLEQTDSTEAPEEKEEKEEKEETPAAASLPPPALFVCVQPWLYLPTAGCEATVFAEAGGSRPRGVVQRHGSLRLMTSAALLQTPSSTSSPSSSSSSTTANALAQLVRFAIPENEVDMEAERLMSSELTHFTRFFTSAAAEWTHRVRVGASSPSSTAALPAAAAWCANLALVLSPPPSSLAPAMEATKGEASSEVACRGAVLLSLSDYQRATEECVLFSFLKPSLPVTEAGSSLTPGAPVQDASQVGWNTQKHPYIPLFSIDQLERLRTPPHSA